MNRKGIENFLKLVGSVIQTNQSREGWVIASCPFAVWKHKGGVDNNPSFGVKINDKSKSHYHCFSCGSSGSLYDMVLELRHLGLTGKDLGEATQLALDEENHAVLELPDYEDSEPEPEWVKWPEYYISGFVSATQHHDSIGYHAARQVPDWVSNDLGLIYDSDRKRVCFPIRAENGDLTGLHGRAIFPDIEPRYYQYGWQGKRNQLIWYGEDKINPEDPVIMVESVYDFVSVYEVYKNVISPLTVGFSKKKAKRMSHLSHIITLFDHGQGGNEARLRATKFFPDAIVEHLIPTEKQDDAGNMTPDELREILHGKIKLA